MLLSNRERGKIFIDCGLQYDNEIGDEGACLLGQALTFSSSVHTLHLVSTMELCSFCCLE
jgi:hypothetical protein